MFFIPSYPHPPAPWSEAKVITPGAITGANYKPAICQYKGRVFLAWATYTEDDSSPATTFSFTTWLPSDDGWAAPKRVDLNPSTWQNETSALVVFNDVLYALVPYKSLDGSKKGLSIFSYNDTKATFIHAGDWSSIWNTPIAAVVCDGILHVVGYNKSDGDHLYWTWSKPGTKTITGPSSFSDNTKIKESTSSNPALIVRDGKVRLLFLGHGDGRGVLEDTLIMDGHPTWTRTYELNESGDSGISATATPDGTNAWICFKTHGGYSNLMCHWKSRDCANNWSDNYSMGSSKELQCYNEAALTFSIGWVYAVWNTYLPGRSMYYSRRPMGKVYPDRWMGELRDQNVSIAALSIPGTHQSASYRYEGPDSGHVRCQAMSIAEQLNAGIRYFDLRVGLLHEDKPFYVNLPLGAEANPVILIHGRQRLGLTLEEVFQYFYDWLDNHPTEALIVQISADDVQMNTNDTWISDGIHAPIHNGAGSGRWLEASTIPTLHALQGKLQLIRRFHWASEFGIDATGWSLYGQSLVSYQTSDANQPTVSVYVESHSHENMSYGQGLLRKAEAMTRFVDAAASGPRDTWYVGYSSYTTPPWRFDKTLPSSKHFAADPIDGVMSINAALESMVTGKDSKARVGTLIMDYPADPTGSLISSIIEANDIKTS